MSDSTRDFDPRAVPIRDAATVMLVRDGEAGMEVFMLKRTFRAVFVGGGYVFPGGAVDDADRHGDVERWCEGLADSDASTLLGIESGGLAYWVAAVRECFEEAGILLAHSPDGAVIRFDEPTVEQRFGVHRRAVHAGERRLLDICAEEGLRLALGSIHYFAHWITPLGEPRRFDTRFFVARAPEAQEALHDDHETIDNVWIRPCDALDQHARGEFFMIFPTIKNLEAISRFATADELMAASSRLTEVPCVQPRLIVDGDGVRVLLPGDPGFDEAPH